MFTLFKRISVLILVTSTFQARAWVDTERYPGHETPGAMFICAGADVAMTGFLTALTGHFFLNRPGSPVLKHAVKIRNIGGAVAVVGAVSAVAAFVTAAYKYGGNFDSGRCYLTKARFHSTRAKPAPTQSAILNEDISLFDYARP